MTGTTVRVQLGGRNQTPIRGYMIVDAQDADLADVPWCMTAKGYAIRRLSPRKYILGHRAVAMRMLGRAVARGEQVDHVNHDRLDNRRANLRIVTHAENQQHRRGKNRNNTSGFRGVSYDKRRNKWCAVVSVKARSFPCGRFDSPEEAGRAAEAMRKAIGYLGA